ncbi:MAG: PQQ-binding-like beta-propeller repeat protein [Verrucomicrobiales bacterium]|nr:PQQ-binding-like beta-propeller repeat protein [Verrucomicrobiales bacterium]
MPSPPTRRPLSAFVMSFGALLGFTLGWASSAHAEPNQPQFFRSDRGIARDSGKLPEALDDGTNLVWKVPLDPGHSTPVVFGDRVFLSTFTPASKELSTVALHRDSGKLLWRRAVSVSTIESLHSVGSPATPSPATDGHRVFTFFGSYGLLCHDLDGKLLWEQRLGPFQDEYGAGSSPVLTGDLVVINQDHDVDSFLAAYDLATGKQVWRTPRPKAVRSYSTPVPWSSSGQNQIVVAGAIELNGYDAPTGSLLWTVPGLARIAIPTPVPTDDTLFVATWAPGGDAGRRLVLDPWQVALGKWDANHDRQLSRAEINDPEVLDRFFRIDTDQSGALNEAEWGRHADVFQRAQNAILAIRPTSRGDLGESAILWKHPKGAPYVASPVVISGNLWVVKDGGIVTTLNAANGENLSEERLPTVGTYFASPVAGDGKVYFASESGVVTVVTQSLPWRVLSSRAFGERIYATPVLQEGRVLIRTEKALYSFGRH